jgi:hypothetical protein
MEDFASVSLLAIVFRIFVNGMSAKSEPPPLGGAAAVPRGAELKSDERIRPPGPDPDKFFKKNF